MMGSLVNNRESYDSYVDPSLHRTGLLRRILRALFGRR